MGALGFTLVILWLFVAGWHIHGRWDLLNPILRLCGYSYYYVTTEHWILTRYEWRLMRIKDYELLKLREAL